MPPKLNSAYFQSAMETMRSKRANKQEDGFQMLLPHANHFVEELIVEFRAETDPGLKCWLLELIGHARSEKAFALLEEQLTANNLSLRDWAVAGLRKLNTKESKTLLQKRGL